MARIIEWAVWSLLVLGATTQAYLAGRLAASGQVPSSFPEAVAIARRGGARYAVAVWSKDALLLASLAAGTLILPVAKLHAVWIFFAAYIPSYLIKIRPEHSRWMDEHARAVFLAETFWAVGLAWLSLFILVFANQDSRSSAALAPRVVAMILAGVSAVSGVTWLRLLTQRATQSEASAASTLYNVAAAKPASDPWDNAIAAAESGRREEAIREFGRAMTSNPNYYISEVRPSGSEAAACWKEAVDLNVRAADARVATARLDTRCHECGKDIGVAWHYDFESIALASTVAAQCPECGIITCASDLLYGPDGNYPPCSRCHVPTATLSAGPAYSSMVDQAQQQRRYRGTLKDPSVLGRPTQKG